MAVSNLDSATLALPPFESPPVGDDGIAAALAEGRPALIVERPDMFGTRQAPRPLEVSGWAWSGAGIETVLVVIDDEIEIKALHDLFRPDLRSLFGDNLATSGFAVRIDPRDWPPGPHKLTVIAIDATGHAIGVTGEIESVAQQPPPRTNPSETIDPLPDEPHDSEHDRFVPSIHRGRGAALDESERRRLTEAWQERCVAAELEAATARCDARFQQRALAARLERHAAAEAALSQQIRLAEEDLARARAATAALLRSPSWRLTAPLRRAKRSLRRARGTHRDEGGQR